MSVLRSAAKLAFATADLFLRSPSGPRILIYHQVGAGLGRQMEVTVENFEWQLDWLAANREVVPLESAIESRHEAGCENLVAITFDDGFRDTFTTAFPRLKAMGFPFTLYVTTGPIESGSPHGETDGADPLTWDQIAEMYATGLLTVGAHTNSHLDMSSASPGEIDHEIEVSDRLLKQNLGLAPQHFAYPYGYWSPIADPIVRRHYLSATIGSHVGAGSWDDDVHLLHRFPIQLSDETIWFRPRLEGGFLVEEKIRRLVRGYDGP